jgi:tetratricopeptide (TPR) repeat protein
MTVSPPSLSSEEQEQLQQTIEMFEVIVQASPQDCQSLEILKDAYARLGKQTESLSVARRLADTYRELGQLSQALLEYETILGNDPNNMEVMAAIGEVDEQLQKIGQSRGSASAADAAPAPLRPPGSSSIKLDFSVATSDQGTLTVTEQTVRAEAVPTGPRARSAPREGVGSDDGNEQLGKFLIQNRLVADEIVASAIDRVTKKNKTRNPNALAISLIDEICRRGSVDSETLLSGIVDRAKFAYIPLEYYEVDRAIVKMLPEEITIGRLIVPFDVMSRTLMVAMANPFDADGKEIVQQLLDYNIQWHLASPFAVNKVLSETYRLGNVVSESSLRLAS